MRVLAANNDGEVVEVELTQEVDDILDAWTFLHGGDPDYTVQEALERMADEESKNDQVLRLVAMRQEARAQKADQT